MLGQRMGQESEHKEQAGPHHAVSHAPQWLGETCSGVLANRRRVRKAAIPRRRTPQRSGPQAMHDAGREQHRGSDKRENQQPIVGAIKAAIKIKLVSVLFIHFSFYCY